MPHVPHGGTGHAGNAQGDWEDWTPWIVSGCIAGGLGIIGGIVFFWRRSRRTQVAQEFTREPTSDYILAREIVAAKAMETESLLADLAWHGLPLPAALRQWVEETFVRIQECWQRRDLKPVCVLLAKPQYCKYSSQLDDMRKRGIFNQLENLRVERIEFVHVDFNRAEQCQFTVLITFRARSYYTNSQTCSWQAACMDMKLFQEFWTFERVPDSWQLTSITPSTDASPLLRPNSAVMKTAGTNPGVLHHVQPPW
jgi:Tim44-like domain